MHLLVLGAFGLRWQEGCVEEGCLIVLMHLLALGAF